MIPMDTVFIFVMASMALSLAPGPDNIFVVTQSALYGRKAGIYVTLGLCTGLLVHTAAVSLGVAAIFQTSELAFNVLKMLGAAYLLYLALQAFRAPAEQFDETEKPKLDWQKLYYRGIIMNITNPKVAIFFLAFLPQFANPILGSVTEQILVFGALFIASAFFIFGMLAWFAGTLGKWLKDSAKAQIIMNRVAGSVFAGLALKLAVSER